MSSDGTLVMPFGKHAGKTIEELPSSYLRWVCENVEDNDEITESAADELKWRTDNNAHFED